MLITTIPVLMLLLKECTSTTEKCVNGSDICFSSDTSNLTSNAFYIKKNGSSLCASVRFGIPTLFDNPWRNGTFNCSAVYPIMSLCFGNCQLNDAGIFSLHLSGKTEEPSVRNMTLQVTIPVSSVTLTPTIIEVFAGQQMTLTCTTSYCLPPATITWHMSSTDNINSAMNKSYSLNGLVKTNSYLQKSVNKSDNGKSVYCTANNTPEGSAKSLVHKVVAWYKPEITSSTPSTYSVIEGEDGTMKCKLMDANPITNITWIWFKNSFSSIVLHNGPNYTIENTIRNMSGSYSCKAKNSAGISAAIEIDLDIQYKPELRSITKNPYIVIEGNSTKLECEVIAANPNNVLKWEWFKTTSPNIVLHRNSSYDISNVKRNMSGEYNCRASNLAGMSEAVKIVVDVLYKPELRSRTTNPYIVIEGNSAKLECEVIAANPNNTLNWEWFKTASPNIVLHRNSSYDISNVKRNMSGDYNCRASNLAGMSEAVKFVVDVHYKPEILEKHSINIANESEKVILTREIISNPLANVSWYNESDLLENQFSVRTASYTIQAAMCTDTKNFTLVASNRVRQNVTAMVELFVNCKPRSYKTNFTLGVTDTTGINFSTTVIAYPEPLINVEYGNGTKPVQMMTSINTNAVNNFTIRISQAVVNQSDFGVYHLKVKNLFGKLTMTVNVIAQRKPNMPYNIEIVCEATRAKVQWKSSFDGGDPQVFAVFASNGQQSDKIPDRGENTIHSTFVQQLQPYTMYMFFVSAQNSHGFVSSENISCTTLAESSEKLPIIVGSAAAGGLTLAVVVIIVVFIFRRHAKTENQAGKSQRFENDLVENESADDDGLKDNILYVSADPRQNEKHEAAVYAAVNKKDHTSNNNSNVYAEVKKDGIKGVKEGAIYSDVKPKKGFFKKDEKVKKEKKQKRKQEVADVYENSDDIAMTAHPDNVYSNTKHNNDSGKEQRGYKNKDGLLYVEVQFDTKAEQRNPVIHGDDEKTDYATVEFPVPSSSHDRE